MTMQTQRMLSMNNPGGLIDNPNFAKWFGKSKAIGAGGRPLMLYHGNDEVFDVFQPNPGGHFGKGIYLTTQLADARKYQTQGNPLLLHARVENPFVTTANYAEAEKYDLEYAGLPMIQALFPDRLPEFITRLVYEDRTVEDDIQARLIELGHDGVCVKWNDFLTHYVLFEPTQIKSASANNGEFNILDPHIYR